MSFERLALLAMAVAVFSGCARSNSTRWPWAKAEVPGPPAPQEYIVELREMQRDAERYSEADREQMAQQFAAGLREEQDVLMRIEVLSAMGALRTQTADAMLRAGLADPDRDVRVACCDAWARRGGTEAVDLMMQTLANDSDTDVRLAASRSLGKLKDRRAIASLGLGLEDSNPAMQRRSMESLREITGEDLGNDVVAWLNYVKQGAPQREISLAERFRRIF